MLVWRAGRWFSCLCWEMGVGRVRSWMFWEAIRHSALLLSFMVGVWLFFFSFDFRFILYCFTSSSTNYFYDYCRGYPCSTISFNNLSSFSTSVDSSIFSTEILVLLLTLYLGFFFFSSCYCVGVTLSSIDLHETKLISDGCYRVVLGIAGKTFSRASECENSDVDILILPIVSKMFLPANGLNFR